jgi:hypothetical protein
VVSFLKILSTRFQLGELKSFHSSLPYITVI